MPPDPVGRIPDPPMLSPAGWHLVRGCFRVAILVAVVALLHLHPGLSKWWVGGAVWLAYCLGVWSGLDGPAGGGRG